MKYTFLLLMCFLGWFDTTPFEYSEATVQQITGGQRRSGRSIHYLVKLVANKPSNKITFQKMWVGADAVEFNVSSKNAKNQITKTYQKGDTIYIDAYIKYRPDENGTLKLLDNGLTDKVQEYQGEAIIEYTYRGKDETLIIKNFTKRSDVNMP